MLHQWGLPAERYPGRRGSWGEGGLRVKLDSPLKKGGCRYLPLRTPWLRPFGSGRGLADWGVKRMQERREPLSFRSPSKLHSLILWVVSETHHSTFQKQCVKLWQVAINGSPWKSLAQLERETNQKMYPNEHFPGKPEQTKDLHLFRKSKNTCFPCHPNVCSFDAQPNTLSWGSKSGSRPAMQSGNLKFKSPLST